MIFNLAKKLGRLSCNYELGYCCFDKTVLPIMFFRAFIESPIGLLKPTVSLDPTPYIYFAM